MRGGSQRGIEQHLVQRVLQVQVLHEQHAKTGLVRAGGTRRRRAQQLLQQRKHLRQHRKHLLRPRRRVRHRMLLHQQRVLAVARAQRRALATLWSSIY